MGGAGRLTLGRVTRVLALRCSLLGDVTSLIEQARGRVAVTVNAELTMLYWGVGTRIPEDVSGSRSRSMAGQLEEGEADEHGLASVAHMTLR